MGHAGQHRCTQRVYGKTKKVTLKKKQSGKTAATRKTAKLRKSLTPGTLLILLAGRFRGKRCVFVKQLESGLLLVTGPYTVNGIPLRRVNQRYCIATSHKVELKDSDYSSVSEEYFKREVDKKKKAKKSESGFFAPETEHKGVSEEKKAGQKKMDEDVVNSLSHMEKCYLKTLFSLTERMYPHELKF
mmetsp:Transcript_164335/g.399455  ORF Transcript_164335/g.399455 Transcript_164335/m.399455 type:complete len:187 (-) Transcript_164335:104-664(-)